jgi:hypothetical protein
MRLSVRLSRGGPPAEAETVEIEVECDDIVPSAEIEAWLVAWSAEVRTLTERWVGPQPAEIERALKAVERLPWPLFRSGSIMGQAKP